MLRRFVAMILLACALPVLSTAQANPAPPQPADNKNFVPLENVVTALEGVLTQIKDQIDKSDPQLTSAEFDFQTVTANDTKGGLIVSVLTLEAAHEKDITRETDFTYSIPSPPKGSPIGANYKSSAEALALAKFTWVKDLWNRLHSTAKPEDFATSLPAAIVAAADTARSVKRIANPYGKDLSRRQFVITLTFGVSNSFNGSLDASTLVPLGPEGRYTRTGKVTQSLKLTFEDPS